MSMASRTIYANPPNKAYARDGIILGSFAFILGILGLLLGWGPFDGVIIGAIMGVFGVLFIYLYWHRENVRRPSAVEVNDDGIIMEFRFSSKMICPWSEIAGIFSDPPESPGAFKGGAGAIILWKSNVPYFTTYEISEAIRMKHWQTQRKEIPQKMLGETERDFKKRIRKRESG